MRALIFRETGEPKSVLRLKEIAPPSLAPGRSAGTSAAEPDQRIRFAHGAWALRLSAGGVQGPMVGTRVVFVDTWNTWREQIVCPADKLGPVPDGLEDPAFCNTETEETRMIAM